MVDGCNSSVHFALDPQARVHKAARTAEDFQKFPDLSKTSQKNFTREEVSKYDGEGDNRLYIIVSDSVYDVTDFVDYHLAGPKPIREHSGQDATQAMQASGMASVVFTDYITRFRVGKMVGDNE